MELLLWLYLRASVAPQYRATVKELLQKQHPIPTEWQDSPPYSDDLIADWAALQAMPAGPITTAPACATAFADFTWKITGHRGPWRELPADYKTTVALCLACYGANWAIQQRMFLDPTFSEDLRHLPTPLASGAAVTPNQIMEPLEQYWLAVAESSPSDSVRLMLDSIRASDSVSSRSTQAHYSFGVGNNALLFLPVVVQRSGDAALARTALNELNSSPPATLPPPKDMTRRIYDWMCSWQIASLREIRRHGYPVDLTKPYTATEIVVKLEDAQQQYTGWAQTAFPMGDARRSHSYEFPWEWGTSTAPKPVQYLARSGLPYFSTRAREIEFIASREWEWGHTFPGVHLARPQPMDSLPLGARRTRYDLARLNIAAFLHHEERGYWPQTVEDLVPNYLPEAPPDPGPCGPYIWDSAAERFELRDPPWFKVWGIV